MSKLPQNKLALVHIIKKELDLNEMEYRHILLTATGVFSAKDLDEEKFRKLMNYFVRTRHYRVDKDGVTIKQKLLIKYLAKELDWEEEHLNNFIHKYHQVDNLSRLTRQQAGRVIDSLKHVREHQSHTSHSAPPLPLH